MSGEHGQRKQQAIISKNLPRGDDGTQPLGSWLFSEVFVLKYIWNDNTGNLENIAVGGLVTKMHLQIEKQD